MSIKEGTTNKLEAMLSNSAERHPTNTPIALSSPRQVLATTLGKTTSRLLTASPNLLKTTSTLVRCTTHLRHFRVTISTHTHPSRSIIPTRAPLLCKTTYRMDTIVATLWSSPSLAAPTTAPKPKKKWRFVLASPIQTRGCCQRGTGQAWWM